MIREIRPLEYLPPVMSEVMEIQEIYKGITPELKLVYEAGNEVLNENFVNYAKDFGLERMEKMLGIKIDYDDTVENRRMRILAKLNGDTPYTFERVYDKLKLLCGEGNVTMEYAKDIYTLRVLVKLKAKKQFETVRKMLLEMLPCNISLICMIAYNTHGVLSNYTHGGLRQYTQRQLREEVLFRERE